jgi:hypothetical protein
MGTHRPLAKSSMLETSPEGGSGISEGDAAVALPREYPGWLAEVFRVRGKPGEGAHVLIEARGPAR